MASMPSADSEPPAAQGGAAGQIDATVLSNGTAPTTVASASRGKPYLVNKANQRVDTKLPQVDVVAERQYIARRESAKRDGYIGLCNNFHVRGSCDMENCKYRHGEPLLWVEALAMRRYARANACFMESQCRDPYCCYAHHCQYGSECAARPTCPFEHLADVVTMPLLLFSWDRVTECPILCRLAIIASTRMELESARVHDRDCEYASGRITHSTLIRQHNNELTTRLDDYITTTSYGQKGSAYQALRMDHFATGSPAPVASYTMSR